MATFEEAGISSSADITPEICPCGSTSDTTPIGSSKGEMVYRCSVCDLMFYSEDVRAQPATDEHWWGDEFVRDHGLNLKMSINDVRGPFNLQLTNLEEQVEGRKLLDVGCGVGLFMAIAREHGWDVKGIDKNPNAHKAAREVFEFDLGSDFDDVPDETYDVVRLSHVLEHVSDPVDFLKRAGAKLKPDGMMMIIVPNGAPLVMGIVNALRRMRNPLPKIAAPMSPGFHLLGFAPESLRILAKKAGLRVEDLFSKSMGSPTYYPMFYDGLFARAKLRGVPIRTLIRYWCPLIVDNIGNPFGKGQWLVCYLKPDNTRE